MANNTDHPRFAKRDSIAASVCAVCFFLLNLYALDRSPMLFCDEPVLNEPAKEFALNGVYRSGLFAGSMEFEKYYYWQPPGYPLFMAGVYSVFGFGITQMRIVSVLFGSFVIGLVFLLSRAFFTERPAALIAVLLLAFDPTFLITARAGRMDMMALFFALLGLFALLQRESTTRRIVFAGLMIGISGIVHPLCIMWWLAGLLLVCIESNDHRWQRTLLFATAAAAPLGLWLFHTFIYGSPKIFYRQFILHGSGKLATGWIWERIIGEGFKYGNAYATTIPYIIIQGAGLLYGCFLTRKLGLKWAVVLTIPLLWNVLIMSKDLDTGPYYLYPLMTITLATGAMFATGIRQSKTRLSSLKRISVAIAFIGIFSHTLWNGIGHLWENASLPDNGNDFSVVADFLKKHIEPNSTVWTPGNPPSEVAFATIALSGMNVGIIIAGPPTKRAYDYILSRSTYPWPVPDGYVFVARYDPPSLRDNREPFTWDNPQSYGVIIWKAVKPNDSIPPVISSQGKTKR